MLGLIADKLSELDSYMEQVIRTNRAVTSGRVWEDTEACIAGKEGSAEGDGHGGWCAGCNSIGKVNTKHEMACVGSKQTRRIQGEG